MLSRAGYEDDEKIFFWRIVNLLRRSENRREILSAMKCQTEPQIELSSKKDQTIIYQVHTHELIQSENFVFYINLFLDNGIVDKKRICKISTFQNQKTCTQTDSLLLRCPYEGYLVVGWSDHLVAADGGPSFHTHRLLGEEEEERRMTGCLKTCFCRENKIVVVIARCLIE